MSQAVDRNKNEIRYTQASFKGLPVMTDKGPLIEGYLHQMFNTIECALAQYPKTLAFRIDLYLPQSSNGYPSDVISRHIEFFKAEIARDLRRRGIDQEQCIPRVVWAKERNRSMNDHYHLLILLNKDHYFTVGKIDSPNENMVKRLQRSWAKALRLDYSEIQGLVNFPDNGKYILDRNQPNFLQMLTNLFYRASYLTKENTKPFGDGSRHFSCSHLTPLPYGYSLEDIIEYLKGQAHDMKPHQVLLSTDPMFRNRPVPVNRDLLLKR